MDGRLATVHAAVDTNTGIGHVTIPNLLGVDFLVRIKNLAITQMDEIAIIFLVQQ